MSNSERGLAVLRALQRSGWTTKDLNFLTATDQGFDPDCGPTLAAFLSFIRGQSKLYPLYKSDVTADGVSVKVRLIGTCYYEARKGPVRAGSSLLIFNDPELVHRSLRGNQREDEI